MQSVGRASYAPRGRLPFPDFSPLLLDDISCTILVSRTTDESHRSKGTIVWRVQEVDSHKTKERGAAVRVRQGNYLTSDICHVRHWTWEIKLNLAVFILKSLRLGAMRQHEQSSLKHSLCLASAAVFIYTGRSALKTFIQQVIMNA